VGEGIVSAIGSADSLQGRAGKSGPDSKAVLAKGLDSNTAFEILSIDIAGRGCGRQYRCEIAERKRMPTSELPAKAEVRRAAAVAVEKE